MDYKGLALVLKRTNFGEADRIVQFLTPEGRMGVMAKGVRKEKSRLAGGIEPFCLSEIVVHKGKSELGTLTHARLQKFYEAILHDYDRLQFSYEALKVAYKVADGIDSSDFFDILRQTLEGVDGGHDLVAISAWFYLNVAKVGGVEPNLRVDNNGMNLIEDGQYDFDIESEALTPMANGPVSAEHIKLMRLMLSNTLVVALKVKVSEAVISQVAHLARAMSRS